MTTTVVEGNVVGWARRQGTGTRGFNVVNLPRAHSWAGFGVILTPPAIAGSSVAPTDGKVVALVLFVGGNDSFLNATYSVNIEGVKVPGMDIVIPAGATGYFFSGPDVAEFDREFSRGDDINWSFDKEPLESEFRGTFDVTVMFMMEMDFLPVVPP